MKTLMKLEVKKAFHNKFFWIAVVTGCLITICSFVKNVNEYLYYAANISQNMSNTDIVSDPRAFVFTVFNSWIGGEPFSLGTSIYFFVFPLLTALPYGWSYSEEKQTGYRRIMIARTGKRAYYLTKYIAVFLSGGVTMILPLVFNFWMVLLVIPVIQPDVTASMFYAVFGSSFLAELYYTMPFLYVIIYLVIDFIYCGLFACISMAVSGMVRQKWVTVIVPFLFLLVVHTATRFIYSNPLIPYKELSPLYFLRGVEVRYSASGMVILLFGAVIFLFTLLCVIKECRDEIY